MKKVLVLLLTLTLTLSMSLCAFAASDKSNNGKGNGANKSETPATSTSDSDVAATSETNVLWTNKTGNLVKLYTEDGKKVMLPVQALKNHGATDVTWNSEDGTVTIIGSNGITVVFTPNSTTATTQALVALGDTSGVALTVTPDAIDPTIGTISGDVPATLTDPLTGDPIDLTLSITATVSGYDAALGSGSIDAGATFSGVYTDTITLQEVTITGTITGTLSEPVYALDADSTSIDFSIEFENQINNGRAYVPIQDLDKLFATELAVDTTTEELPDEEAETPTI